MKKTKIVTSIFALFVGATIAQGEDTIVNITSPVKDFNAVPLGTSTSGKLVVNVNGTESDTPYTVAGTLNLNAGNDVFTDNWNGSSLVDSSADAITLNVNSGTIQTTISGQKNKGTSIYGNVVQNINGGTLGYGTQRTADCNVISGMGTYGVTDSPIVIYGNNTLNIGSNSANATQPTIYGYVTTQQGAIIKGDTYLNMMGGTLTSQPNTYTNLYAGPNYKGVVEGNVYLNISGGTIEQSAHGGGVGGANAGTVLGSINVTINGGTITGNVFGGYSGTGNANGVNVTLVGDGSNINIGGFISGGNRGTTDCTALGTKTLYVGNSNQAFISAQDQTFDAKQFDNIAVSSGSSIVFDNLEIYNTTTISLETPQMALFAVNASTDQMKINNLSIVFTDGDFTTGDVLNDSNVASFGIVLSAMNEGDTIKLVNVDSQSQEKTEYYATLRSSGIEVGIAVPEPSTYAIIFGAIALGFVAYRRRK